MAGDQKSFLIPKPTNAEETSSEGVNNMAFSASSENMTSGTDTKKQILNKEFLKEALLNAVRVSFKKKETAGSNKDNSLNFKTDEPLVVLDSDPQVDVPAGRWKDLGTRHIDDIPPVIAKGATPANVLDTEPAVEIEIPFAPGIVIAPRYGEPRGFRRSCRKFASYLREFTQSWVMILVLLVKLGWPCFYIFLGIMNVHNCNFLPYFPIMYVFMGVSGVMAITSRVFRNVMRMYPRIFSGKTCSFCRYVTYFGVFFFVIVYCVEGLIFVTTPGEPTTTPGPFHCGTAFYAFTKWNLLVVIVLGLLMLFFYFPTLWGLKVLGDLERSGDNQDVSSIGETKQSMESVN